MHFGLFFCIYSTTDWLIISFRAFLVSSLQMDLAFESDQLAQLTQVPRPRVRFCSRGSCLMELPKGLVVMMRKTSNGHQSMTPASVDYLYMGGPKAQTRSGFTIQLSAYLYSKRCVAATDLTLTGRTRSSNHFYAAFNCILQPTGSI